MYMMCFAAASHILEVFLHLFECQCYLTDVLADCSASPRCAVADVVERQLLLLHPSLQAAPASSTEAAGEPQHTLMHRSMYTAVDTQQQIHQH
jgi:hypothetical protein